MSWIYGLCLLLNLGSFSQYFFKNFSAPKSFFFTPGYLMKQNVIPSGVVSQVPKVLLTIASTFFLLLNLGKLLMICLQVHRLSLSSAFCYCASPLSFYLLYFQFQIFHLIEPFVSYISHQIWDGLVQLLIISFIAVFQSVQNTENACICPVFTAVYSSRDKVIVCLLHLPGTFCKLYLPPNVGWFSAVMSSNISSVSFFPSFLSGTLITCVCKCLTLPHRSLRLYLLFLTSFFFFSHSFLD